MGSGTLAVKGVGDEVRVAEVEEVEGLAEDELLEGIQEVPWTVLHERRPGIAS